MKFVFGNLPRLILLGLVATFTSEVLSTNITPFMLFSPLIIILIIFYFLHFVILDDVVARFKLDYKRIFLLGVVYGHFMEAFGARSHFEDAVVFLGGWQLLGINWDNVVFITFWQGLFTTVLTFLIVNSLIKRKEEVTLLSRRRYIISIVLLAPLYFLIGSEVPFPPLLSIFVMTGFIGGLTLIFFLFSKNLSGSNLGRKKRGIMAIILLIIATPLGFINPGYSGEDALFRLILTIIILILVGRKAFFQKNKEAFKDEGSY